MPQNGLRGPKRGGFGAVRTARGVSCGGPGSRESAMGSFTPETPASEPQVHVGLAAQLLGPALDALLDLLVVELAPQLLLDLLEGAHPAVLLLDELDDVEAALRAHRAA